MPEQPVITVIVPTSNRADSLARTLHSLSEQDYPADRFDVLVVDDGSTDNTREIVDGRRSLFREGQLRYEYLPKGNITRAKNRGVDLARGDVLVFTDDDCTFEPDWLKNLVAPLDDPAIGAVGGPDRGPENAPPLAVAVDYGFTGLLGSGGVRSGGSGVKAATYFPRGCNMAVRRRLVQESGGFDTRFFNGEEIDLDYRIIRQGAKTVFQPSCPVWHHRRATFRGLVRQVFGRGVSRRMLFLKSPDFFEPGYFVPGLVVSFFAAVGFLSIFSGLARLVLMASVLAYAALLLAGAVHCWLVKHRLAVCVLVPAVIAVQHFMYGAGLLAASFQWPFVSLRRDLRRAATRNTPLRVLISNDGFGTNQGDRAILAVMQSDLRERFPGVEIRGFLNSWIPGPLALWRFWCDMRWADVFLLGGGQVLHDQTCLLFLLAALYKLGLARLAGTPAVCYAVGAGPLQFAFGRRLVRHALNTVDLVIARDESTRSLLEELGVRGPRIEVTADPAWRLPAVSEDRAREILRDLAIPLDRGPLIAICPRRWFHYRRAVLPMKWRLRFGGSVPGGGRFAALTAAFARLADWLNEELRATVVLVPMKNSQGRGEPGQDDDAVCMEIAKRAGRPTAIYTLSKELSPSEMKAVLGQMSCVVSMRMHAVIMASAQGVPCVGVGLSEKFNDVFARAGMERSLIAAESADADGLFALVKEALAGSGQKDERIARTAPLAELSRRSVELLDEWLRMRYAGIMALEEGSRGG
ncbi:MAG: polysaccharide pyruvyl transferase family protein [bacterium]